MGFSSIQNHWEVLSNFEFRDEPRKLRLLITSQWIWIEKNPTVHLHYFIHRVRQNCQTNHFPILRERFLVSFFKILNLKNRWFDDVTWLLSTNFMKNRQGECLGKISHPYRVWKVYKHRFSENTELAIGRTLKKFSIASNFQCWNDYSNNDYSNNDYSNTRIHSNKVSKTNIRILK